MRNKHFVSISLSCKAIIRINLHQITILLSCLWIWLPGCSKTVLRLSEDKSMMSDCNTEYRGESQSSLSRTAVYIKLSYIQFTVMVRHSFHPFLYQYQLPSSGECKWTAKLSPSRKLALRFARSMLACCTSLMSALLLLHGMWLLVVMLLSFRQLCACYQRFHTSYTKNYEIYICET